jgi:carbamoyltransferase
MRVLGINAIFHHPSPALVADGQIVAAAEEERCTRPQHDGRPVPFTAWEPERTAQRSDFTGFDADDLDAVACSYRSLLAHPAATFRLHDPCDHLRRTYAQHAPSVRPTHATGSRRSTAHTGAADLMRHSRKAARLAASGRYSLARFLADGDRAFEEETR